LLLNAMGARVRVVAPSTLLPQGIERMGVEVARDMREGLDGADIVMMLRLQRERMNGSFVPSTGEYFHYFGLDQKKLAYAKPDGPGDVLIADGVIRDARRGIGAAGVPEGTDIINCAGKVVAPGLIDLRAFVGEPGASHRETFASASQAAAAGGITTIICQPDTSPVIDNSATVDFVLRRARDTAIVNIQPMAALTKGLGGEEMTEIGLLKAAGAVAFTDGDKSVTNAQVMRRALTYARDFDALIVHHTEDPNLVGEGVMNEGEFAARLGLIGIPNAAEAVMLERDMRLVALT